MLHEATCGRANFFWCLWIRLLLPLTHAEPPIFRDTLTDRTLLWSKSNGLGWSSNLKKSERLRKNLWGTQKTETVHTENSCLTPHNTVEDVKILRRTKPRHRHSVQWVEIFREKNAQRKKWLGKISRRKTMDVFTFPNPFGVGRGTFNCWTVGIVTLFENGWNWHQLKIFSARQTDTFNSICHFWHFACEKNRHNHTELQHGCGKISKTVKS